MPDWKPHVLRVSGVTEEFDDPIEGRADFRRRLEPWLSAILQSEHLNVLLGSGFTIAVAAAARAAALDMSHVTFGCELEDKVNEAAERDAQAAGRGAANIEDQFNAALALLAGLTIQGDDRANEWDGAIRSQLTSFMHAVLATERGINDKILSGSDEGQEAERLLVSFLLTTASRTPSRERPHFFTTNYDRVIESGCDSVGLRILDRFVGLLTPIFRSARLDVDYHYNPPGIRGEPRYLEGVVKLTKLHGSIDWRGGSDLIYREALPFGAAAGHPGAAQNHDDTLLIYPNASKELASAAYPYAELLRDFSSAVSRPNSALLTYGYGFGDEHINRVIKDMLSIPSTHLAIVSWDDAGGRIRKFVETSNAESQTTLLIGSRFGDLKTLVDEYLPKPAIDQITTRVTDMLRRRSVDREGQEPVLDGAAPAEPGAS